MTEADRTKEFMLQGLKAQAQDGVFRLLAECLGKPETLILQALGVDVKAELLHIFVEELELALKTKGETDATV